MSIDQLIRNIKHLFILKKSVELESSSYDDSEVERTELESGSESGSSGLGIIILWRSLIAQPRIINWLAK